MNGALHHSERSCLSRPLSMAASPKSRRRSSLSRGRIPPLSYKMESPPSPLSVLPLPEPPRACTVPHRLLPLSPAPAASSWSCCLACASAGIAATSPGTTAPSSSPARPRCRPNFAGMLSPAPPLPQSRRHPLWQPLHRLLLWHCSIVVSPACPWFRPETAAPLLPSSSRSSSGRPFHSTSLVHRSTEAPPPLASRQLGRPRPHLGFG